MKDKLSFVGIQTMVTKDIQKNFRTALDITDEALRLHKKVDMLVLPEYFYWAPDLVDTPLIGPYPEEIIHEFSIRAKLYNTYIIAGTVANRREDGNIYNTALLFDRNGDVVGKYDKVHLFDALNAMGGERESDQITRGSDLFSYDADFGKIGISICYDVRFPEVARTLALRGVKYLFTPAAFYTPRQDHWEKLLISTALHNSMYVTGLNLYGKLDEHNTFCGRSLIADPWGVPVAMASDKQGFIQAYVDPDYTDEIKDAVGTFHNRVPDVYDIK
ncbi:hypothetical protein LI177_10155 [bacterium 210820-DFI.6.37]|nr:hypothetical protein [bacterium 210820-DFI.6.37]